MIDRNLRGNIPAHQTINGAYKRRTLEAIIRYVAVDGVPFAITLTPNSTTHPFHRTLAKLNRLCAALAHGPRGVPRSCDLRSMGPDRPRIVGFEEGAVGSPSGARIRHFHGLLGIRNAVEEQFCRNFLDRHWSRLDDLLSPSARSYELTSTINSKDGAMGWLRYATKPDAFVTVKEPIFIG